MRRSINASQVTAPSLNSTAAEVQVMPSATAAEESPEARDAAPLHHHANSDTKQYRTRTLLEPRKWREVGGRRSGRRPRQTA